MERITAALITLISFVAYPAIIIAVAAGVSGCGVEFLPARLHAVAVGSIPIVETIAGTNRPGCEHQISFQYKDDRGDIHREVTNGVCAGQNYFLPFPSLPRSVYWECTTDRDIDRDAVDTLRDNCPMQWNPDQMDKDLDGLGTACDSSEDLADFERRFANILARIRSL